MKKVGVVSLGSSDRDEIIEVELFGEQVRIERVGTDGDRDAASKALKSLDGLDALGVGGTDLGMTVGSRRYPFHTVMPMVKGLKSPVVDGTLLEIALDRYLFEKALPDLDDRIGAKRALCVAGADRWGMTQTFFEQQFDVICGDLLFNLGLPVMMTRMSGVKRMAAVMLPIVGRLPIEWVYPVPASDEVSDAKQKDAVKNKPKFQELFHWASVVVGDSKLVTRNFPMSADGIVVFTNKVNQTEIDFFKARGVQCVVTSEPVLQGHRLGTEMLEAAFVAASGRARSLTVDEIGELVEKTGFSPEIHLLN